MIGIFCLLSTLTGRSLRASNATWSSNPASSDWNTAGNWIQGVVPTGTATFELSNLVAVTSSLPLTEIDKIIFSPGASSFNISTLPGGDLIFNKFGVVNNSGVQQNFSTSSNGSYGIGFIGASSAGVQTVFTIASGGLGFGVSANAEEATIINLGANILDGTYGITGFDDRTSAAMATITNQGGQTEGGNGGLTLFEGTSEAGTAVISGEG